MGERAAARPAAAWYALRLRSRFDATVCRDLQARGYETFFPTLTEISRWTDREKRIERPLFPGYGFARFEVQDLTDILRTRGVASVLGSPENAPQPVDDAEISSLRRVLDATPTAITCAYVAGSRVRVESGPMAGVEGTVIRTKGATRLVVSVPMLNRCVAVEFNAADVEAAA